MDFFFKAVDFCARKDPFKSAIYFFDGPAKEDKCSRQALLCQGMASAPLAFSCPSGMNFFHFFGNRRIYSRDGFDGPKKEIGIEKRNFGGSKNFSISKNEISEAQKIFRIRKTKFRRVKKFFELEKPNFGGSKNFSSSKKGNFGGSKNFRNRKMKFRRIRKIFEIEKRNFGRSKNRNFDTKNDRKSTSKRKNRNIEPIPDPFPNEYS
jgi:hypothetical protein